MLWGHTVPRFDAASDKQMPGVQTHAYQKIKGAHNKAYRVRLEMVFLIQRLVCLHFRHSLHKQQSKKLNESHTKHIQHTWHKQHIAKACKSKGSSETQQQGRTALWHALSTDLQTRNKCQLLYTQHMSAYLTAGHCKDCAQPHSLHD